MSLQKNFYIEQATNCAREADEAKLPNLRAMFLRSQKAWQALADRKGLTDEARALREAGS